jgi:inner membrane protein
MGKMLAKIHKNTEVSWIMWTWTVFLSLFTHALLDTFTVYGTQLLKPVTDHPFGINSIFIVDLVYTVPMVAGIIISLFLKKGVRRHRLNVITLAISTIYLLMSLGMKLYTLEVFKDNLERENIQYEDIITMPTALNIVMFECIARDGDDLYVGLYSVFEDDENIRFRKLERNTELIENDLDSRAIKKLLWFSRGYYKVHRKEDGLHFSDLRFGRSDLWLSDNGEFVFDFKLVKNEKGEVISFKRGSPGMEINKELFKKFFNRVLAKN